MGEDEEERRGDKRRKLDKTKEIKREEFGRVKAESIGEERG